MDFFTPKNIYEIISAISSLAVIFLTGYTFYLSKLSNKIEIVSKGLGRDVWHGYNCMIAFKNCSLHDISVLEIGVLYKSTDSKYWNIKLSDFRNEPMIIKPFEIKKIQSEWHQSIQINTRIDNIDIYDTNNIFYFCLGDRNVFFTRSGMSQCKCNTIFKKYIHNIGSVMRLIINYNRKDINITSDVKYIIHLNTNNQDWKSLLLNSNGIIDGEINGYNAFPEIVIVFPFSV